MLDGNLLYAVIFYNAAAIGLFMVFVSWSEKSSG